MINLDMIRGKRVVFIGTFPSTYRAYQTAVNLGWTSGWNITISFN